MVGLLNVIDNKILYAVYLVYNNLAYSEIYWCEIQNYAYLDQSNK